MSSTYIDKWSSVGKVLVYRDKMSIEVLQNKPLPTFCQNVHLYVISPYGRNTSTDFAICGAMKKYFKWDIRGGK